MSCPSCQSSELVSSTVRSLHCRSCTVILCPSCKEKEHTGVSCEKYSEWKTENSEAEARFIALMKAMMWRICPICGAYIERISGCRHMICHSVVCKGDTHFCYDCGNKLNPMNSTHTCILWRF